MLRIQGEGVVGWRSSSQNKFFNPGSFSHAMHYKAIRAIPWGLIQVKNEGIQIFFFSIPLERVGYT